MKRVLSLVLAVLTVLSFTGCIFTKDKKVESETEKIEEIVNALDDAEEKWETSNEPETTLETESASGSETVPETESEPEVELDLSFLPQDFYFSSGAGGWGTEVTINRDGSFVGTYHDSDMGSSDGSYPNGTVYICSFEGQFAIEQINSYSYSMKVTEFITEQADGDVWIEDGIRYIGSSAYGFSGCTDFILYTKDAPESDFTEEFKSWSPGRFSNEPTVTGYAIFNTKDGYGFFTYEY